MGSDKHRDTAYMLHFIQEKLGPEEAERRVDSVARADQCRVSVAIYRVYRSLGGK